MIDRVDLTAAQQDAAIFLPALSTFYSSYVGKQRHSQYVEQSRIPVGFENGVEGLNYLNPNAGYFTYKWSLYSAGHANLDLGFDAKEDMVRNRDENSWLLGDSGGFQIGKGVWEGDWNPGSGCAKAQEKRDKVLRWMDAYMDYGMTLDIPGWVSRTPRGREATKISSYEAAVAATRYNYEYWMNNRSGRCKFLTVLQGDTHTQADEWYDSMKEFCDPNKYPDRHFNGWAMGSQNKCDMHLVLHRLVTLIQDGLLETGKQDWVHYLGTSKLEWAVAFTQIQRAIRRYHNPNFTISYDCASPFLATANGQVYHENRLIDDGKWSYKMTKCVDDKKYAQDTRMFRDAIMQDMPVKWPSFMDSPIMQRTQIRDICHYAPGELNKIGKEGKTSWDSFSYAILMAHNIFCHIDAVQQGNRLFDQGCIPRMLKEHNGRSRPAVNVAKPSHFDSLVSLVQTPYHDRFFEHLVTELFTAKSRDQSNRILMEHTQWFTRVYGSSANGMLGPKAVNSLTSYQQTFGDQLDQVEITRDDSGLSEKPLDLLESEIQKEQ
jgi:hypothetical protein